MARNEGRGGGFRGGGDDRRGGGSRGGFGQREYGGSQGGGYGGERRFNAGPREMHKATCSDCGKECEVPFKPTTGKPVYCRECFANHKKF
ncbi:MAG TPA: CxxC-x17-CxxC domain-containing protein [Candidatus Nanoarchaeia archaeon]|nr:CxxC-x17-CxxC domain-containing protein [Candidatus Nanoarchaeia archaeon]